MSDVVLLSTIRALEQVLVKMPGSFSGQVDNEYVQTQHFFAPGVYVRQLTRKKGILIVGKMHREACVTILLSGELLISSSTNDVKSGTIVSAGAVWVSKPGTKRATYALEDSVLLTVHPNPTDTQDLAELEAAIIVGDDE